MSAEIIQFTSIGDETQKIIDRVCERRMNKGEVAEQKILSEYLKLAEAGQFGVFDVIEDAARELIDAEYARCCPPTDDGRGT